MHKHESKGLSTRISHLYLRLQLRLLMLAAFVQNRTQAIYQYGKEGENHLGHFALGLLMLPVFAPAAAAAAIDFTNIKALADALTNAIAGLAASIALGFFIWGAIQKTATPLSGGRGDEDARRTMMNAAIGMALVVLAYVIMKNIITGLGGGGSTLPTAPTI